MQLRNRGVVHLARTLCWFDLSGYNATTAGSTAGQHMSVALPGGYSISFTLKVSGGQVKATAFPTFSGAYLGNKAYTGVGGKPALYQTQSGTTTTAALSAIAVVDSQDNPVSGYSFVGADAESTDATESITWDIGQESQFDLHRRQRLQLGGAAHGCWQHHGEVLGHRQLDQDGHRHPCRAQHPSTFSQTMVGQGLQGVAFGVLVSTVQLTKTVASRISPTDAFAVNVSSSIGPVTCPQPTLAPGNSETCIAANVYTVTAADVTAGAVNNTATASGVAPAGTAPVTSGPSSTSTSTLTPKPAVSLVKSANASGGDTNALTVGETVAYFYLVTTPATTTSRPWPSQTRREDQSPARTHRPPDWLPGRRRPAPPTPRTSSPRRTSTTAKLWTRRRPPAPTRVCGPCRSMPS
jgi:hypothetical protein